jgi:hypothetical protein
MTRFVLNVPFIIGAGVVGAALGAAEMVMSYRAEGWFR